MHISYAISRKRCKIGLKLVLITNTRERLLQNTEDGVLMDSQVVNNLRFADDIDLIAESETDLQELTDKVNCYTVKKNLTKN